MTLMMNISVIKGSANDESDENVDSSSVDNKQDDEAKGEKVVSPDVSLMNESENATEVTLILPDGSWRVLPVEVSDEDKYVHRESEKLSLVLSWKVALKVFKLKKDENKKLILERR